jgi:hypothetical protein
LVRTAGIEPALPEGKQILSLLRIPFRHVRFSFKKQAITSFVSRCFPPFLVADACDEQQAFLTVSNRSRQARGKRRMKAALLGFGGGGRSVLIPVMSLGHSEIMSLAVPT